VTIVTAITRRVSITNSLDGYTSNYCGASRIEYYVGGSGMKDIAIQYDLQNFSTPVIKANFKLKPFTCFHADKLFLTLKTSKDEISFARPCKSYTYETVAFIRLADKACSQELDVTEVFNKAINGTKKLQLFIVDTYLPDCDAILPGTSSAPSCVVNFQGKSDAQITKIVFRLKSNTNNYLNLHH
jgi:hypothetical protein